MNAAEPAEAGFINFNSLLTGSHNEHRQTAVYNPNGADDSYKVALFSPKHKSEE